MELQLMAVRFTFIGPIYLDTAATLCHRDTPPPYAYVSRTCNLRISRYPFVLDWKE